MNPLAVFASRQSVQRPFPFALTAVVASIGAAASAADVKLDTALVQGPGVAVVVPGGTLTISVSVRSAVPVAFNAALWRLVVTEQGSTLLDYDWTDPFVTGGPNDFSLGGAELPLVINDDTLEGTGYPIQTADVEFGAFDFVETAGTGELMRIMLRAPKSAEPGSHFFVAAMPDLFTYGFLALPTSTGTTLRVNVVESAPPGDLDNDGTVGAGDLSALLARWGQKDPDGGLLGDLNGDGVVDATDLSLLLNGWTG